MQFHVEWHDRLDSTNAHLRREFLRGARMASGRIVAAREQYAGRGRQGRSWQAAPHANLCFSLFIETHAELPAVPSLTMAAALAAVEMFADHGIDATPKWPNDVLVAGKKICGILSERIVRQGAPERGIIVGAGLNINMTEDEAQAIGRPATSMLIESGRAHAPAAVLEALFVPLELWIGRWELGGFSSLRSSWSEKSGPCGKPLTVHDGGLRKSGTLAGYGEHGELLLQTENGIETIWSGDVS